ncbi:hypothetical protein [Paraburkholderia unamae]|nr:hypothetical protein [Paraburkholderia unamae]
MSEFEARACELLAKMRAVANRSTFLFDFFLSFFREIAGLD